MYGLNVRWHCRIVGRSAAARGKARAPPSSVVGTLQTQQTVFPRPARARDSQWTVRRWSARRCVARNAAFIRTRVTNSNSRYRPTIVVLTENRSTVYDIYNIIYSLAVIPNVSGYPNPNIFYLFFYFFFQIPAVRIINRVVSFRVALVAALFFCFCFVSF